MSSMPIVPTTRRRRLRPRAMSLGALRVEEQSIFDAENAISQPAAN